MGEEVFSLLVHHCRLDEFVNVARVINREPVLIETNITMMNEY